MHNITVTYETVVTKKLSLDIDQVIDLVVENTKKDADGEEMSLFDLQCVFGDNMNYYLEKLGLIKDSEELSDYAEDEIFEEFTSRIIERYPELDVL